MAVVYSKVLLFDPPLIYTAPDTCVFGAVHVMFQAITGICKCDFIFPHPLQFSVKELDYNLSL